MAVGSQLHRGSHLFRLYKCSSVESAKFARLHPAFVGQEVSSFKVYHGSSMGWIPLKIEHTSPGPSPCPWAQRETSGTYLWVTAGITYPYESTNQVPWGTWNEDLSPYDSRNLALTSQVLLGPGCPQGRSGSPCFINSTLRRFFGHRHQRV